MRVARLKELLANVSDDAFVVLNGSDHSYRHTYIAEATTAVVKKRTIQIGSEPDHMSEDHHGELAEDEARSDVLLIG